jgi:hypothetical protein
MWMKHLYVVPPQMPEIHNASKKLEFSGQILVALDPVTAIEECSINVSHVSPANT